MAGYSSQLQIVIDAQNKATSELKKLSADMDSVAKSASNIGAGTKAAEGGLSSFFGNFEKAAAPIGIAAVAMGLLGGQVLKLTGEMEQTVVGFTTLLGNGRDAVKFVGELRDLAAKTPFELAGLTNLATRFLAVGYSAEEAKTKLIAVGEAASAMGIGQVGAERITLALTQMTSRGKLATGEMNQLAQVGINGFKMLAEATGKTEAEIREMTEKGLLNGKVAVDLLAQSFQQNFSGSMEKQSQTLLGLLSTLKDAMTALAVTIGSQFLESAKSFVRIAIDIAEKIGGWAMKHQELITIIVKTVAIVFSLIAVIVGAAVAIGKVISIVQIMAKAVFLSTGPFLALIIAIAAVIAVAIKMSDTFGGLKKAGVAFGKAFLALAYGVVATFKDMGNNVIQILDNIVGGVGKGINKLIDAANKLGANMEHVDLGINFRFDAQGSWAAAEKKMSELDQMQADAILKKSDADMEAAKAQSEIRKQMSATQGEMDKNLKSLTSGVGGGGDDGAAKKMVDKIDDVKMKLKDMVDTGKRKMMEMKVAFDESTTSIDSKMEDLAQQYVETSIAGQKKIQELKDNNVKNLAEIEKSMAGVQKQMADLNRDFDRSRNSDVQNLAEAFVAQEQSIKKLKEDLMKSTDAGEIGNIKQQISAEEDAYARTADTRKQFAAAIAEAQRRAALSDVERAIEDFNTKRNLAQQEYDEKMSQLQSEMNQLVVKRDMEKQQYAEKLLETQTELQKNLDKITKEQFALGLQKAEEQKIYDEATKTINAILADAELRRQQMTQATMKVTIDSLNNEIQKYNELTQAIQRASSARNMSLIPVYSGGTATGGRAVGGPITHGGLYNLHAGEYVVPRTGAGVGGMVVNINGGTYLSESAAETLGDMIIQRLKNNIRI